MSSATNITYDCAVIGGGPAGASVAYALSKYGYRVVLFERESGSVHKVCGEFISAETVGFLKELGIDVEHGGAPLINRFQLCSPRLSCEVDLPSEGYGFSRFELDHLLLEQARRQGADIRQGTSVLYYERKGIDLFRIRTTGGVVQSRSVFLATGKHDLNRRNARPAGGPVWIGLKLHVHPTEKDVAHLRRRIVLFTFGGGYGGLSLVESGDANLCFILRKEVYRTIGGGTPGVIDYLRAGNRHLDRFLDGMQRVSMLKGVAHIPYGYFRPHFQRSDAPYVYALGDQAVVVPSLTGNGIAWALLTGKLAAECFHRGKGTEYHDRLKKFSGRMMWAMGAHRILTNPWFTDAAILSAKVMPGLIDLLFRKTRLEGPEPQPKDHDHVIESARR